MTTKLIDQKRAKEYVQAMTTLRKVAAADFGAGKLLCRIHGEKLYLADLKCKSFSAWLERECPFSRPHAYSLMNAAKALERLDNNVPDHLRSTRRLSVLAKAAPEHLPRIVKQLSEPGADTSDAKIKELVKTSVNEAKKPKPAKATTPLQESYKDDTGRLVPESLFPVFRTIGDHWEIARRLSDLAHRVRRLGEVLDTIAHDRIAETLIDIADAVHGETPARMNGDDGWLAQNQID